MILNMKDGIQSMTLNEIIADKRFSELKEIRQKRRDRKKVVKYGKRVHETEEHTVRVGFKMHFDGLEFQCANLDSLERAVSSYCDEQSQESSDEGVF